jgi:UDP-N-acetylmuramoyl-L-alanyl-D-glutamate--2,6-diaminopimelate ligase
MRLPGAFHVGNALAAAAAAVCLGVPDDVVATGLCSAPPVPGRFEVLTVDAPFTVVVDYAHTPDALAVAIESARQLAGSHHVICLFGCGGERDPGKRPVMGALSAERADLSVVTSDNPRGENPLRILNEILGGIRDRSRVIVEPDRGRAVEAAVDAAEPGDVVLLAGKGHETVIEQAGVSVPFDDRQEARDAVNRRFASSAGHLR